VRSVFFPLLAIGVEMILFPFGGLKLQVVVVGTAGDGGCFFWAGSFGGSEGVRSRLFWLLRAPTLKLLMFFQGFRCVLSVVSDYCSLTRFGLLRSSLEKSSSSTPAFLSSTVSPSTASVDGCGICSLVPILLYCNFLLSRDLSEIWGRTVMLF
jgi:hypothetical protein